MKRLSLLDLAIGLVAAPAGAIAQSSPAPSNQIGPGVGSSVEMPTDTGNRRPKSNALHLLCFSNKESAVVECTCVVTAGYLSVATFSFRRSSTMRNN